MNYTRLVLAAVVATIVDVAYGFGVYGTALGSFFAVAPGVFRSMDAVTPRVPYLVGGTLLGMLAASYIYAKGYEGKSGAMEGIRFGILIAIFSAGFFSIAGSATMNWGLKLAVVMSAAGLGEWILVGLAIGLVYKPAKA
jgi:hypothetical protein